MRFLTRIFSSNDEEEEDIISDVTNGNTLSWSTRIKCFLFCFLFGIFLSVMGSVSIFFRNFVMFSILFSIGSVMSMARYSRAVRTNVTTFSPAKLVCIVSARFR
ncbi:putative vesicle transport protein SFT2A (SFT2 domain-containing protein 1) [Trichinella spiralis]|uniref:putative vesicle transport protein SFT2A (SFT2 domain-containing protein 1) n=1 Tax=Trichinella spiralis TaxID=6334 RepID=UPI0001EFC617|nr:putative vesicle transport protein SFT2A (SFT2 domain-containing protein 1) [Trichinella spiralis]